MNQKTVVKAPDWLYVPEANPVAEGVWLRWWDAEGNLLLWGSEKAELERLRTEQEILKAFQETQRTGQEAQRAEQEAQKALEEKQRGDRLAEKLRELSLDPDNL